MKFFTYLFVAISVFFLICVTNSWKIFDLHPASVHQWRQSDCAAYVKTFYRNNTGILTPGTFNLAGKEGRVASEFPLIYYTAAKIQTITGEHYWVIRGLTFLCYIIGLVALLGCISKWIPNRFYAAFSVAILATSPFYYYYALNFLPNIPAISFSFLGLFFFLRYEEKRKMLALLAGTLSFILATLLKPTDGGMLLLAYFGVKVYHYLFGKSRRKENVLPILCAFLVIVVVNIGWVAYVNGYNDVNGNHQNLIGIYPIWDMDKGMIRYTAWRVLFEWSNVYQQKLLIALLSVFLLVYILRWKRLDPFLKKLVLFLFMGSAGYSLLWFKAYTDHDYYQLVLVLPAVFLSIAVLEYYFREIRPKQANWVKNGIAGILIISMGISIYHNRNIQFERYTKPDYVYINPALYEIEPYLLKIGVTPQSEVVCVPDKSPNTSLNAINRYGYSEEFNSRDYNINTFQAQGADYLIISDSSYLSNPLYLPFEKKKIGTYKGVYIFDIRNSAPANSSVGVSAIQQRNRET